MGDEHARPRVGAASLSATDAGVRNASRTVYLHIGLFKSGTSFIQSVLLRNRAQLERDGFLFPTDDGRWSLQVRAARDVLEIKHHISSDGAWDELVEMIH